MSELSFGDSHSVVAPANTAAQPPVGELEAYWQHSGALPDRFSDFLAKKAPAQQQAFEAAAPGLLAPITPLWQAAARVNLLDAIVRPEFYANDHMLPGKVPNVNEDEFTAAHSNTLLGMMMQTVAAGQLPTLMDREQIFNYIQHKTDEFFTPSPGNFAGMSPGDVGIQGLHTAQELIVHSDNTYASVPLNLHWLKRLGDSFMKFNRPMERLLEKRDIYADTPLEEYYYKIQRYLDNPRELPVIEYSGDRKTDLAITLAVHEVSMGFSASVDNLRRSSRMRNEFSHQLTQLGALVDQHPDFPFSPTQSHEAPAVILRQMEVDWTILPPGELKEKATEIVDMINARPNLREVGIDLERLRALEIVRERWGSDRAYYATGSLTGRHIIRDGDQECPDEYVMLILQDIDEQGRLHGEHAIAESPVTGEHATYVFRYDIDDLSWRDVMALSKPDARDFNARPIAHRPIQGRLTPEITAARITTLLNATHQQFVDGYFNGTGRLYVRRAALATLAGAALSSSLEQ